MFRPGEIPESLFVLSPIERRVISLLHVFITVVILPGGQHAEKGMAIYFPAETAKILQSLLHIPHENGFSKLLLLMLQIQNIFQNIYSTDQKYIQLCNG